MGVKEHSFWWQAPDLWLAKDLFTHVEGIEEAQRAVHEANLYHACLYSNREEIGINWMNNSRGFDTAAANGIVTNNVIKQVIDTATSIIAKNKPRPRVLTSGAEWVDQRRAKKLEKFLWAEFSHRGAYRLGPSVFRDACIWGTGLLKVLELGGTIKLERTIVDEIIVDERDCINSCVPREMFQRRLVDKTVLCKMYPELDAEIEKAAGRREWTSYRFVPNNQILVVEAWRPPSIKGADDHRHVIAIEGAVLLDEGWDKDFPFIEFRWSEPITGYYGQGITEELVGVQVRLNQLNRFIQKCQDMVAVPRVFVDVTSGVLKSQLDDRIGEIVTYRGKPPTFFTPQALTSEIYSERDNLVRGAFERIGISQLSAQSLKPAGLESAVALREFNEIEGQRFAIEAQRYELWYMDLARAVINQAREIRKGGSGIKTKFQSSNLMETIDWADVDLEEDRFELSIQAASILTMSPAARLQAVTELAQVGQLDKSEIRYLLSNPDLERSDSVAYADFEDIERNLEVILDGNYQGPEPFQNLVLGMRRFQQSYLKAKVDGAPEDILEGLRTWIVQASDLVLSSQPPAPTMPGDPGAEALPADGAVLPPAEPTGVVAPQITEPPLGANLSGLTTTVQS